MTRLFTAAEIEAKSAKARAAHRKTAPGAAEFYRIHADEHPHDVEMRVRRPAEPTKYRAVRTEHAEQKAVIQWFASFAPTVGLSPLLLFAVPNGAWLAGDARQRAIQMRRLKDTGLRPGVPDLFLAVPCTWFHGLFVEMKRSAGGRVSDDQRAMALLLESRHYQVVTCAGADDAARAIKGYLERRA